MTETQFKKSIVDELHERFEDCVVIKNDPTAIQGFPDLTVFWKTHWATLEIKKSQEAPHRPNQDYWVNELDRMSFSDFIYPENRKEVLDELERFFTRR